MIANFAPQPAPRAHCPHRAAERSTRSRRTANRTAARATAIRPRTQHATDLGGITALPRVLVPYIGADTDRIHTRTCTRH